MAEALGRLTCRPVMLMGEETAAINGGPVSEQPYQPVLVRPLRAGEVKMALTMAGLLDQAESRSRQAEAKSHENSG